MNSFDSGSEFLQDPATPYELKIHFELIIRHEAWRLGAAKSTCTQLGEVGAQLWYNGIVPEMSPKLEVIDERVATVHDAVQMVLPHFERFKGADVDACLSWPTGDKEHILESTGSWQLNIEYVLGEHNANWKNAFSNPVIQMATTRTRCLDLPRTLTMWPRQKATLKLLFGKRKSS
eukprot:scaffold798_cov162-Amphora_coffeaeformis.AAC.2